MIPTTPKIDTNYREYAAALWKYHESSDSDGGDEVERIEGTLDALWDKLDEDQRRSLRGLSSDLNWIRRRGQLPPKGRTEEQVTQGEVDQLVLAQINQDWHAVLHHLRVCASTLGGDVLAYSRATCYHNLGLQQFAVAAVDLTLELIRDDNAVGRIAFEALSRLAPGRAFDRASQVLIAPSKYPPLLVVQCIGFMLDTFGGEPDKLEGDRIVSMIRTAYQRLEASSPSQLDRGLFYLLAAAELQAFGQEEESRKLYAAGLVLEPDNPQLLAGLGMSLYEDDPAKAVELFRKAVLSEATFPRPYMYLAHYHLVRREFELAYGYAKQALEFANDKPTKAAILDIMALSAGELALPAEQVLKLFREAVQLAPDSPRLAANLKTFQESAKCRSAQVGWEFTAIDVTKPTVNTARRKLAKEAVMTGESA